MSASLAFVTHPTLTPGRPVSRLGMQTGSLESREDRMRRNPFQPFVSPALITSLCALIPIGLLLTSLTASADGPATAAGGLPSAGRLQQVHESGRTVGGNTANAERMPNPYGAGFADAPNDLLRSKLDDYLKEHGSQWSEAEREVFSEAYWEGAREENVFPRDSPQTTPPDASSTTVVSGKKTVVSGKTATPGPGTIQFTDVHGNSYFGDVDKNGSYSVTVPRDGFYPTKMTLRTSTIKAAWERNPDGKTWTQVSGETIGTAAPTTTPTQGATAPREGTQQQLLAQVMAVVDPCERALLVASSEPDRSVSVSGADATPPRSSLLRVRFLGGNSFAPRTPQPDVRLVGDPLPPEVVGQMNKLGKDIADYEHQQETLEKELRENKDAKTGKRLDRDEFKQKEKELDNVKNKLKSAEQNKQFVSDDARKVAEDAYKARKVQYALPEQIRQLRAKGDQASLQQVDMMERQLQALNQFYGPIALAPTIVPPGQSGYALANAAASLGSENTLQVVKGHTTQVATTDIRRQQETEIELDSLVHLEENGPSETVSFPAYFGYNPLTNRWGKPDLSLAATWTGSDSTPPIMASIASDGTFAIKDAYNLKACVKLNVAYGYDHVSTAIDGAKLAGDYHVTFNRNPTWIAGFKTGVNIDRFQQDYMQAGAVNHSQYTWTHWQTPFADVGMISSGQISAEGYNQLSWTKPYTDFMVYGELSPGTNPDPLPGLDPTDWPRAAAYPGPILILPGSWLEGELP